MFVPSGINIKKLFITCFQRNVCQVKHICVENSTGNLFINNFIINVSVGTNVLYHLQRFIWLGAYTLILNPLKIIIQNIFFPFGTSIMEELIFRDTWSLICNTCCKLTILFTSLFGFTNISLGIC